jgi:hypothetical protein
MPYSEYPYLISATLNNRLDEEALVATIIASEQDGYGAFSVVFDHISIDGGAKSFSVWFKNPLPDIEKGMLDRIVADHRGDPLRPATPVILQSPTQPDDTPLVAIASRIGNERVVGTHNYCDPCSWFGDSIRAKGEMLTDSGDGLTFTSTHVNWIDMISGRMHNDTAWVYYQQQDNPGDPHGYQVVVDVNGVQATMREPFEVSGGDFEVDWDNGVVVFFASQSGKTVTADYSYATTSTFHLAPRPGKILIVEDAETDVSADMIMTDDILYGGWYWDGSEWVDADFYIFHRAQQIMTEAKGDYPAFKAVGATEAEKALSIKEFRRRSRGMRTDQQSVPFNYATIREIVQGTELRVWLKHDRPYQGEAVTMTFYCIEATAPT